MVGYFNEILMRFDFLELGHGTGYRRDQYIRGDREFKWEKWSELSFWTEDKSGRYLFNYLLTHVLWQLYGELAGSIVFLKIYCVSKLIIDVKTNAFWKNFYFLIMLLTNKNPIIITPTTWWIIIMINDLHRKVMTWKEFAHFLAWILHANLVNGTFSRNWIFANFDDFINYS